MAGKNWWDDDVEEGAAVKAATAPFAPTASKTKSWWDEDTPADEAKKKEESKKPKYDYVKPTPYEHWLNPFSHMKNTSLYGETKPMDQSWLPKMFRPETYLGKPEDSPDPGTMARELTKHIPVVGHAIKQTPEMTEMEKNWPKTTTLANIVGPTAATMPLGIAAQAGKVGFLPTLARQGTLNAGLNTADTIERKGTGVFDDGKEGVTTNDILRSIGSGYATGGVSAGVGKALSPVNPLTAGQKQVAKELEDARKLFSGLSDKLKSSPSLAQIGQKLSDATPTMSKTPNAALANAITEAIWAGGGAGVSMLAGQHPLWGVAGGIAAHHAAPYGSRMVHSWANNPHMQEPQRAAIMNAILNSTSNQAGLSVMP